MGGRRPERPKSLLLRLLRSTKEKKWRKMVGWADCLNNSRSMGSVMDMFVCWDWWWGCSSEAGASIYLVVRLVFTERASVRRRRGGLCELRHPLSTLKPSQELLSAHCVLWNMGGNCLEVLYAVKGLRNAVSAQRGPLCVRIELILFQNQRTRRIGGRRQLTNGAGENNRKGEIVRS